MIAQIERLLKSRIGLDAESVGRSVIERAIRQRMNAQHKSALEDYWIILNGSPKEQQALVEAVVVPETWFFRYPESFKALATLAFEYHTRLNAARPLRIISVPCSSGEEPYSIAMTLLDAGFAPEQFQIEALDVSDKVLALASRGIYGRNSFRGDSLTFRKRFFRAQDDSFVLDERVKSRVQLRCGNLLDSTLFSATPAYDFIFCRNLLIYFDRATQVRVLELLKRQLQPQGVMFIGPAEASLATQNGMQALGRQQTFAFRLAPAETAKPISLKPPSRPQPVLPRQPTPLPPTAPRRSMPAPPPTPATPAPAPISTPWDTVAELANAGHCEQARSLCERHLQTAGPSAQAFYWLGLLSDVEQRSEQACGYYRKAIYLDPQHREALTHLAAHLETQGDQSGAQRLYRRAQEGGKSS